MKVVILVDSLIRGGAERQALLTLKELARRGFDVRLVRYYESPGGYDWPADLDARVVLIEKEGRPIRFMWRFCRYLRREQIDVVHGFKDAPGIYACICGWLAGVPVRIVGHRTQSLPVGMLRRVFRWIKRFATAWIGNTQAVVDVLRQDLGVPAERLFVVHNGLEADRFQPDRSREAARERLGIAPDAGVVTMVAVLRAGKNHKMFVRMAARVRDRKPNTVFLIVGDSDPSEPACLSEVQAEVRRAGLEGSIRFLGMRTDIPDILCATDVSVLTTSFEGMSNALLESMAAGVSVVSTDYVGARELVVDGEQGFLVPLNDDQAMADRVIRLLEDPSLRSRMGRAGADRVEREFSTRAMGERLEAIYMRLVSGRGALPARASGGRAATARKH